MTGFLDAIRAAGARHGLNLVAAIPADRYDLAVTPAMRTSAFESAAPSPETLGDADLGPRSIVIVGNGGGDFWRAFSAFADGQPGWRERANPLDDFTREIIERELIPAVRKSGARCLTVYPFMHGGPTLNFIELAKLAGLGGPSIIGVVLNPAYGPWIAFRAALSSMWIWTRPATPSASIRVPDVCRAVVSPPVRLRRFHFLPDGISRNA